MIEEEEWRSGGKVEVQEPDNLERTSEWQVVSGVG